MSRLRADRLLLQLGLFDSRAKARAAIEAGGVSVDGRPVLRPSELLDADAALSAHPAHPWVGRGGVKLDHALSLWPVAVAGRTVLDVGASTGGFTEVCLSRGAGRVFAVDVGRGQLHPRLAADPRVFGLEGVDARSLDHALVPAPVDLIVCDASFIGLSKVLPAALALAAADADLIALVKPQFEAGPADVGKGGVVREAAVHERVLAEVSAFIEGAGWRVRGRAPSPITGADGNIEHLLWAQKGRPQGDADGP